jgi:hypothetical protein
MPLPVLQAWNVSRRRRLVRLAFGKAEGSLSARVLVIACATLALLGCPERPNAASAKGEAAPSAPPTEHGTSAVPPTGTAPLPVDEGRIIDLTGGGGTAALPSELHPREGADGCMEMDTVCIPEGQSEKCTSARFELACGEEGKIPSTGEHVRCACP